MLLFENFSIWFKSILIDLFPTVDFNFIIVDFDYNDENSRLEFGDISSNMGFLLAKQLKKNPKEIAEIIKNYIQSHEAIDKVVLAGVGFINIYFRDVLYREYYKKLLLNDSLLYKINKSNKKYNIEFVSANPTGPLHIGHGRGGIIGDVCAKVLALKGYQVVSEYYINDAGVQIEKLGKSLYYQYGILSQKEVIFPDGGYQGEYIVDIAKKLYQKYQDTLLEKDIVWFSEHAKNILLTQIQATLLDYQIEYQVWFSEKILHVNNAINEAVNQLSNKGFTYFSDEGTLWFKSTVFGDEKDRVLKKSDGLWTYTAADIAYFLNKLARGFTDIVMILGQDHHSFKIRIEAIAQALEFNLDNLKIILYQLVTLKNEGEIIRMSKRKGNSIELKDIIDSVGSDVARFFYLQRKADTHLDFDLKEALEKSNKNPVFYIQYALVRIKSILEKSKGFVDINDYSNSIDVIDVNIHERVLLRKIALFDSILDQICDTYYPHVLTYYAIELATLFHAFYTLYPVISDDKNTTCYRLGLNYLVKQVLEKCANLLGISIPERM